jgi:hypothetical protein
MAPVLIFRESGCDVTVYSMEGGPIPIDEGSLSDQFRTADVDKFMADGMWSRTVLVPYHLGKIFDLRMSIGCSFISF